MKTKIKLKTFALGGLILILVFGFTNVSLAQGGRGGRRRFLHQRFAQLQLTEEQREELKTLTQNMRDQGADRKAIHEAVQAKLDEWGIVRPERPIRPGRFGNQLTEAQREEIKTLIQNLRDQEADRKAIHEAVQAKLEEWGIEKTERGGRGSSFGRRGLMRQLSKDQRKILREKMKDLRDQEATREEMRAAIQELLDEWGIELPQKNQNRQERGANRQMGKSQIRANNRPNPFNPETIINYTLENPEHVTVKIYNIQGQLIRTLVDIQQSTGTYNVRWNSRHDNGEMAPAGTYIYRIEAGQQSISGRMTLMK